MTPILIEFPTSFQNFLYSSGSLVASFWNRSSDFLISVRWSWFTKRDEVIVSRETVSLQNHNGQIGRVGSG